MTICDGCQRCSRGTQGQIGRVTLRYGQDPKTTSVQTSRNFNLDFCDLCSKRFAETLDATVRHFMEPKALAAK